MVGTAVVREAEWLYLFAVAEPRHEAFLLRLPAGTSGDLSALEWWCGEGRGWQPQVALQSRPDPIFEDAATEFSVHRDPATGSYIQLQSQGFPASDVSVRTAARLTGPWTPLRKLYRPPQSNLPGLMVYAAKAHPELEGAPLLVTYATNGDDARMAAEPGLYFPRFLRLSLDK
jgi:hypothetical protein